MPIVMSKAEWNRINSWTDHDKSDPDVIRRREYVRYLEAKSKEMTKTWPNSLENVNKRNEELRRARLEAAEKTNTKFYKKYVKRKKEEQQRLMFSARDTIFKNKDAPKLMLSAVIETVVQKERAEQVKFLKEQQRQAAEVKRKDDDDIIRKAVEWHQLMDLRKKRRFEANKQHQIEILEQAHEVAERNRIEYETELGMQKVDNIRAQQEMTAINEFEEDFKEQEKKRIFCDMEQSRKEANQRAKEVKARDELDDKLLQVLQKSRARVEATREKTEKELRAEKLRILEKISQKLESGDAARDAKEQAIRDKARKERNEIEQAQHKAYLDKLARFKQDKIDTREQFLKDEAQRLHEFNTMRQWEIMNRFKNAELYEDFQEKLRKERERKIKEYREEIIRLWKEREDREARERAETRYFYGELAEKKIRDADNKLLAHAAELIEEARQHGRPDRPLRRAIDRYCKMHRLYPMPPLPTSLQEHYQHYAPWDGSQPDPDYRQPTPPPPDWGPDAPDEEEAAANEAADLPKGKRDGLQAIGKVDKTKPAFPSPGKPEKSDDYKRRGRANGLQRSNKQHDFLPIIKAVPCKTPDCACPLNKEK